MRYRRLSDDTQAESIDVQRLWRGLLTKQIIDTYLADLWTSGE